MKKLFIIGLGLFFLNCGWATPARSSPPPAPISLNKSEQIMVVITPTWHSVNGKLQRYQRENLESAWRAVGKPIPVVVGKKGLAWDPTIPKDHLTGPIKTEGDMRTPAGIFALGRAFGFAPASSSNSKLPYTPITPSTVCVDDANSKFYNKVLDRAQILQPDWNSGEEMHEVPGYEFGIVVKYNVKRPVHSAGSCIFMHIWSGPDHGTSGCVAMSEDDIEQLLTWLDPDEQPLLVVLTKREHTRLKNAWQLPK